MLDFQCFVWGFQRSLRKVKKPIVLFYGNGYESQLLLMALLKTRRKFTIVHIAYNGCLPRKTSIVLRKFKKYHPIILHAKPAKNGKKTWGNDGKMFEIEDSNIGLSMNSHHIIFGMKLDEPSIVKAWQKNALEGLDCPLLRFPDEEIDRLYSDMVDTEPLGKFMKKNLTSD